MKNKRKIFFAMIPITVICVAITIIIALTLTKDRYRLIKINESTGDVMIGRGNEELAAFDGLQLIPEDIISVEENAFLELLADGDKHIGAEGNTGFMIHSEGDTENGYIAIDLLYGKALFTIENALNENDSFQVTTPNATMSVRGTSFSVAYSPESATTTVEVFDGTVWAEHGGITEELNAGDLRMIEGDQMLPSVNDDAQGNPSNIELYSEPEPVFMLTRYFDIPISDTSNFFTNTLEFTYCNGKDDSAQTNPMDNPPDTLTPLEQTTIQVYNEFMKPVMDQVDILIEEQGEEILRAFIDEKFFSTTDVTDWFASFENNQITIQDNDGTYSFTFTSVKVQWVYTEVFIDEEEGSYLYYEDLYHIDDNGKRYAISGVTFTFYE
ncbi:MAG: FecR domain-containing protein [Lachnospiraceae bacterium]